MKKQKILIVHNYYQVPGGEDTVIVNEKQLLEEHGHEVELYTRHNNELKDMFGIQKVCIPFTTIFNCRTYREIQKLIREKKIDIVHVHNTLNLISPAVYYAARKCNVPIVQTIHNFRLLCPKATFYRDGHICEECLERGLWCAVKYKCYRGSRLLTLACVVTTKIHRATGIYKKLNYICLTSFTRDKLLSFKQIKPNKVYIKPNFTYDYGGGTSAEDYYVFVGRIEEIKGVDMLVEAFKLMPDRKLKMFGKGELDKKISEKIKKQSIKNIEMEGYQSHDKIQEAIRQAKGLIMCSQCYESFAMVVVEAFSVGTPAIVGDIGNIRDWVKPGKTGERFTYNSSKSLVEAIARFEAGNMENYRRNVYDFYKSNYTPEKNYKRLVEIYEAISTQNGEGKRKCYNCY